MSNNDFLKGRQSLENDSFPPGPEDPAFTPAPGSANRPRRESRNRLMGLWEGVSRAGLAETSLRLGTHFLLVALLLLVAWGMREFYLRTRVVDVAGGQVFAAPETNPSAPDLPAILPVYQPPTYTQGLTRQAQLHTDVPSRPRIDVITYTVQKGDTLFGIAEKFGLKPETILWANQFTMGDNPHNLRPDQELNILPIDGAFHKWSAGDGLNGVAKFFNVTPEDILNYPGNNLNKDEIGDYAHPNIEPGKWLIIPGGRRAFVSWSAPEIPRDNPGVAKVLGPGACEKVSGGAVGIGMFIWPANNHFLSGYDYNPNMNHPAVDVDGNEGDPVYAADNGVIVYAGWNNWGYGNMIVINHGNGWQTLYAHLSAYNVGCGQNVYQGNVIGQIGNTGRSSGPHLHFEMMYNGAKVNPHNYLP